MTALLHRAERALDPERLLDDVIDASVVDIAIDGDEILTSDAKDMVHSCALWAAASR